MPQKTHTVTHSLEIGVAAEICMGNDFDSSLLSERFEEVLNNLEVIRGTSSEWKAIQSITVEPSITLEEYDDIVDGRKQGPGGKIIGLIQSDEDNNYPFDVKANITANSKNEALGILINAISNPDMKPKKEFPWLLKFETFLPF